MFTIAPVSDERATFHTGAGAVATQHQKHRRFTGKGWPGHAANGPSTYTTSAGSSATSPERRHPPDRSRHRQHPTRRIYENPFRNSPLELASSAVLKRTGADSRIISNGQP
jgi:hypothetical protein